MLEYVVPAVLVVVTAFKALSVTSIGAWGFDPDAVVRRPLLALVAVTVLLASGWLARRRAPDAGR